MTADLAEMSTCTSNPDHTRLDDPIAMQGRVGGRFGPERRPHRSAAQARPAHLSNCQEPRGAVVTAQLELIRIKLEHLSRMRGYLQYSLSEVEPVLLLKDWASLPPDQHESLATFRVRFSEFQEHLGKTMRSVAIEEEQDVERFGPVLAYMERLEVIDSADH